MPFIATAISAIGSAFAAGGILAAGGALSIVGKLLVSTAISLLGRAMAEDPEVPGIRNETTQAGGINPASFILGRYATGGTAVCPEMSFGHLNAYGTADVPNEFLVYVIDIGDIAGGSGLEQVIIDGVAVTLGETSEELAAVPIIELVAGVETQTGTIPAVDLGFPGTGDYAGNLWVKFRDGTETTADPYLRRVFADYPERPWTEDMIGAGVPHVILTFRRSPSLYRGYPQCRFVVGGIPIYDWRRDSSVGGAGSQRWADRTTWEPSENPIVQIYNILRGIDFGAGFVWGGGAPLSAFRAAEWTVEANKADLGIALSGGGEEPQFRTGFEVNVFDEPASVIEELLRSCAGQIADVGGVWRIRVGAPALPVWNFNDDDVMVSSPQDLSPFPSLDATYNAITATFPDPEANWEPTEAPARYNALWEGLDQNRRLPADLNLPAAPYSNQVQRVMKAYIETERRFASHIITVPPDGSQLEPLDVASWASVANGYGGKGFEVTEIAYDLIGGNAQISLREVDPADHDWQPSFELPFNRPSNAVVARPPAYVRGASVTGVTLTDAADAARRPAIELAWSTVRPGMFQGLEWELRVAGQTSVRKGTTQSIVAGQLSISEGILPDTDYQLRARWVADQEVAWTPWLAVTTPDVRLGAADIAVEITGAIITAQADIAAANALIAAEAAARASADSAGASAAQAALEAEAGAIRDELAEDVRRRVPVEVQTTSELERLAERVTGLMARASETQSRITDAGIYVDAATGKVRIEAISRLDGELGEARIALDALAGSISLFVSKTYVDGAISAAVLDPTQIPIIGDLELRLNTAELALDASNAAITAKADSLTVSAQDTRLTTAESNIDGLNAAVALKASTVELADATARLTTAEATLESLDGAGLSIALTDTRRLSRDAETLAEQNLSELARGYFAGEAQRQDLAFLRTDMRALVTEDREAIAGLRTELGVAVDDAQAKLILEQEARATADAAEASQRLALSSRLDDVEGTGAGNSTAITALTTRTDAAEGVLVTQANALTSLASELNSPITGLAATRAALSDLATTSATADTALAGRAQALEATVNSPTTGLPATRAQLSAADTTLANATTAVAGRTTVLEATAGSLAASVTAQSTAISTLAGNAAASYVLRARAGGAVGEIEVVAGDNPAGASSAVRIKSDRFQFEGDLAEFLGTVKVQAIHIGDNEVTIPQSVFEEGHRDVSDTEVTLLALRVNKLAPVVDLTFGLTLAGVGGGTGIWLMFYRDASLIKKVPVNSGQDGRRTTTTITTRDDSATGGFKTYTVKAVKLNPSENQGWNNTCRVSRTLLLANQFRR